METSAELVLQMIKTRGLNRMAAWNMARTDKIYFFEGKNFDEMAIGVQTCESGLDGPYSLEVWNEEGGGPGRKGKDRDFFRFVMGGRNAKLRGGSVTDDKVLARLDAIAAALQAPADTDETDEPEPAASPLMDQFVNLAIRGLEKYIGGHSAPAPAPAPVQGVPGAEMDPTEMRDLLTSIAKLKQADPNAYAQYAAALRAQYPPDGQPGE